MIEERIYNYLTSFTDVLARVNRNSIAWCDVEDKNAEYPRLTYKRISNPQLYQSTDQFQRYRFWIVGPDKFDVIALLDLLKEKLNRLYGDVDSQHFHFISLIDEGTMEKRDDGMYEIYADYRFSYTE